jgi:DNA (cytosine-5)-methyltransferase 1
VRPRLLDLFCGAGGAAVGYHRAGFEVVGVDIEPQPHYPFEFRQLDVMKFDPDKLALCDFDAVHASPPCQGYSRMRHLPWLRGREYPLLIEPVRELLRAIGLPWVIENVEDSPLVRTSDLFGSHGVLLCGTMFGLPIYRHRPFESNVPLPALPHGRHREVIRRGRTLGSRAWLGMRQMEERGTHAGHQGGGGVREAFGIDWMTTHELSQAIPPAYTEYIGAQLMLHLSGAAALSEPEAGDA